MGNIPVDALTIGGLFIGLAIPLRHLVRWIIKHSKTRSIDLNAIKELIPLTAGTLYGFLASAATSGLIGFTMGVFTWLGNGVGSLAMWGATGGDPTLPARSNSVHLTGEGNLILMLVTVAILTAAPVINKKARAKAIQGVGAGALLGLSATLGGFVAAALIPMVNGWGGDLVGSITAAH